MLQAYFNVRFHAIFLLNNALMFGAKVRRCGNARAAVFSPDRLHLLSVERDVSTAFPVL